MKPPTPLAWRQTLYDLGLALLIPILLSGCAAPSVIPSVQPTNADTPDYSKLLPPPGTPESLIPEKLNALLGEIRVGMKRTEAEALMKKAFPTVVRGGGMSGGRSVVNEFVLDGRYILQLGFTPNQHNESVVAGPWGFHVLDRAGKRHLSIQIEHWPGLYPEKKNTSGVTAMDLVGLRLSLVHETRIETYRLNKNGLTATYGTKGGPVTAPTGVWIAAAGQLEILHEGKVTQRFDIIELTEKTLKARREPDGEIVVFEVTRGD